jgi:hypothetical protein
MSRDDFETTVRQFASAHRVLRVMCDLMVEFGEFDRRLVVTKVGVEAPSTL